MKKRLLCGLLAVTVLVGLIFTGALRVSATEMTASEECIAVLKKMEGFVAKPYYDNGQYSVGYGSGCGKNDYPNGITEAQADALLRKYVTSMEKDIRRFLTTNRLTFTQNQFDAMVLFTYNVGSSWMFSSSDLRTAVLDGVKGNDFIYYFSRWSTAGYETSRGLVKRRLAEADLYLNGFYSVTAPSHYSYVLFDSNGGSCVSRVQGYDASQPPKVIPTPVHDDPALRFLGWYTEKEGGAWVTDLDTSVAEKTLYAHWQTHNMLKGTVNYTRKVTSGVTVYQKPGSDTVIGNLDVGEQIRIIQDFVDAKGVKWGRLSTGGWLDLACTGANVTAAQKPSRQSISVKVTGDYVNVRTGPGAHYPKSGTAYAGQVLAITETKDVGGVKWGKFSTGWICLMYTDYDSAVASQNNKNEQPIATGKVQCVGSLNVRGGAGVSYAIVGSLTNGTKVSIYEKKTVAGHEWGRIGTGWICLDYVVFDSKNETPEPEPTEPEKPDDKNDQKEDQKEPQKKTGVVFNCSELNVRSAPGTHNPKVASLKRGTRVEILEETTYSGIAWGRVKEGWISMHYVQLDYNTSGSSIIGTVYNCNALNIRKAPGTNQKLVGSLPAGSEVRIYEQTTVGGMPWGRVDQGWVCMSYIRITGGEEAGGGYTGVVNTNGLRIRSSAGVNATVVGYYQKGEQVQILETTTVNGVQWGRTVKGWICLIYVTR